MTLAPAPPLRYVKWTQEVFPAAGGKEQLLKALEAATQALSGCERYYGDPRFLRMWIQYVRSPGGGAGLGARALREADVLQLVAAAQTIHRCSSLPGPNSPCPAPFQLRNQADCLPDPSDVFLLLQVRANPAGGVLPRAALRGAVRILMPCCPHDAPHLLSTPMLPSVAQHPPSPHQDRGIGRDLALLYEAYATFLELKGAYARADLVYQEGVDRCWGQGEGGAWQGSSFAGSRVGFGLLGALQRAQEPASV